MMSGTYRRKENMTYNDCKGSFHLRFPFSSQHCWSWHFSDQQIGDPQVKRVTGEEEGLKGEQPATLFKSV